MINPYTFTFKKGAFATLLNPDINPQAKNTVRPFTFLGDGSLTSSPYQCENLELLFFVMIAHGKHFDFNNIVNHSIDNTMLRVNTSRPISG